MSGRVALSAARLTSSNTLLCVKPNWWVSLCSTPPYIGLLLRSRFCRGLALCTADLVVAATLVEVEMQVALVFHVFE